MIVAASAKLEEDRHGNNLILAVVKENYEEKKFDLIDTIDVPRYGVIQSLDVCLFVDCSRPLNLLLSYPYYDYLMRRF